MRMFFLGAVGYPLLEVLYRGRTHYSMSLAGGAAMVLIRRISRMRKPLWHKALLCGLGITGIEAVCGAIWNKRHQVWDYRRQPLNWRGQVCAAYSVMWCALSACILTLMRFCPLQQKRAPPPKRESPGACTLKCISRACGITEPPAPGTERQRS